MYVGHTSRFDNAEEAHYATMHTRQAQLQLGDYYKKAEFLKSKRIKELIRQKSQDSRRVLLLPVPTIRYHLHASMTDARHPRLSVDINFFSCQRIYID